MYIYVVTFLKLVWRFISNEHFNPQTRRRILNQVDIENVG